MPLISKITEKLFSASHDSSIECAQKITDVLCEILPIKAASFYSFYKETNLLTLRSQTGFDYADYKSMELPLNTIAGDAITKEKVIREDSLINHPGYRDKNLVTKYDLSAILAFPIPSGACIESYGEKICQTHSGVVCIYPIDASVIKLTENELVRMRNVIGKVYDYSVSSDRMLLRADIVKTSITSKDLNSFLNKVVRLLSKQWGLEASSVFIFDKRNDTLYMRATTGLKQRKIQLIERIYRIDDVDRYTVKCFLSEAPITIVDPDKYNQEGKYSETVRAVKKSEIYVPIYEPADNEKEKEIIGVFRSLNRVIRRRSVEEVCCHGWEDVSLLMFVSEVIGVIGHLFQRVDDIILNFERAMHGINKPLHTAKVRLNTVQTFLLNRQLLPPQLENYIKNSVAYMDALDWQIQKHAGRDSYEEIETKEIKLYGEVLSKVVAFAEALFETYNVKALKITNLQDSGFKSTPIVIGNDKALQTVFRNVIENALKYHSKHKKCEIDLRWWSDKEFVYVGISDNGLGVDKEDAEKIFREGYRADEAMRRAPTGTGIGLSDSRDIMRSIGGDLYLKNNREPTEFVIKVKRGGPLK